MDLLLILEFNKVGVDYAGPFQLKFGATHRPTTVKAYVCVYISIGSCSHLELVSDLTTKSFFGLFAEIHCLPRQANTHMERPLDQLCWCFSGKEGSSSIFGVPENTNKDIRILQQSIHTVEFHSRTCPTFSRYLGSSGKVYEVSLTSYCLWCMTDF